MKHILLVIALLASSLAWAQEQFKDEVLALTAGDSVLQSQPVILFTGSSSIRLWKNLKDYFPDKPVLNRGFGGSTMSDLVFYFDKLVLPYKSKQVFIYEGDNDIASGKKPEQILKDADSLLALIRANVSPTVEVLFISPKPSLSRWKLKEQYVSYNQKLKAWTKTKKHVTFVDVWTPMIDASGNVMQDIFIEDGLHLNKKGYDLWAKAIGKHVR